MTLTSRTLFAAAARFAAAHRIALLIAGLVSVAAGWLYRQGLEDGKASVRAQQARVEVRAVRETLVIVQVRYKTDTLRLRQWRTRWDTLVQERRIHDTVWVTQVIAVADSTIRACGTALSSCERLRLLEQRRAELAEQQLRTRQGPSRTRRALELAGAAAAGVVAGRLAR